MNKLVNQLIATMVIVAVIFTTPVLADTKNENSVDQETTVVEEVTTEAPTEEEATTSMEETTIPEETTTLPDMTTVTEKTTTKPVVTKPATTTKTTTKAKKVTNLWAETGRKSLKVVIQKTKGSDGYVIYRSTKKKKGFKKVKTIYENKKQKNVKETDSFIKWTNKKLKKSKTYYYKVKSFKIVNGKKKYSSYSKTISESTFNPKWEYYDVQMKAAKKLYKKWGISKIKGKEKRARVLAIYIENALGYRDGIANICNRTAVCGSASWWYAVMAKWAGIESYQLYLQAGDLTHSSNIVVLNKKVYYIDVTPTRQKVSDSYIKKHLKEYLKKYKEQDGIGWLHGTDFLEENGSSSYFNVMKPSFVWETVGDNVNKGSLTKWMKKKGYTMPERGYWEK